MTQAIKPVSLRIVSEEDKHSSEFEVLEVTSEEEGQRRLFHSDELVLPSTVKFLRKPVVAIHSIPQRRDKSLSLSCRKLMEALPLAVQLDLRSRKKDVAQELIRQIRDYRATPLFEIRTRDLAELAGLSTSNLERIYTLLADLVGYTFTWNILGEDEDVEYEVVAAFLVRRDKGVSDRKRGYTRFAIEPEVLMWFLEPTMWATLSWTVMRGLGGSETGAGQEAAFGLYQNAWRYLGTETKSTPLLSLAHWIDLIIGPSRFVKIVNGEKTVVDYGDFKRRHLLPAMALLNVHPALSHTIHVKETFSGRKVVKLRFYFKPKLQAAFDFPLGWPQETLDLLKALGHADTAIAEISQVYSYNQVMEALKRMTDAEQRMNRTGKRIYSKKAFFQAILLNVAKGEAVSEEAEAQLLKEAERQKQKELEEERMRAMQTKFQAHQRAQILEALNALSAEERDTLFQAHLADVPADRALYRADRLDTPYLAVFRRWLEAHRPELYETWLPEQKDRDMQSWMAWQLMTTAG